MSFKIDLSPDEIKFAIEKNQNGYTFFEIAEALFINQRTLRRKLKERGYTSKDKIKEPLVYGGKFL